MTSEIGGAADGASDLAMVDVVDVHKSYGKIQAVKGASLQVRRGEVRFIIGPSGCGKSTLLRCINLLEEPTRGQIRVGNQRLVFGAGAKHLSSLEQARYRARVGMVFQQFHLFPHMTVLANIMEGPRTVKRMAQAEARDIAEALLAKVGLADKRDVHPRHLSGGQAQRVAIARALAMSPEVVLFDEVTSALDPELVGEVLEVIRQLTVEGMTMIIVTHEMSFAREVAGQVTFMEGGAVIEQGSAEEVLDRPNSPRIEQFLRRFRR